MHGVLLDNLATRDAFLNNVLLIWRNPGFYIPPVSDDIKHFLAEDI
jgi:hypothetical protein